MRSPSASSDPSPRLPIGTRAAFLQEEFSGSFPPSMLAWSWARPRGGVAARPPRSFPGPPILAMQPGAFIPNRARPVRSLAGWDHCLIWRAFRPNTRGFGVPSCLRRLQDEWTISELPPCAGSAEALERSRGARHAMRDAPFASGELQLSGSVEGPVSGGRLGCRDVLTGRQPLWAFMICCPTD